MLDFLKIWLAVYDVLLALFVVVVGFSKIYLLGINPFLAFLFCGLILSFFLSLVLYYIWKNP